MRTSERQLFRARFAWLCNWLLSDVCDGGHFTVTVVCLPAGPGFIGSCSKRLFRYGPYCSFSSYLFSFPPLPAFGATSPPLKILSSGSLFSFARRNRKNQHGQSSSGSCGLGCGAVAPMPFQIHWTQHHFSRRLGRTLCTWSIFHLGTKGVSFS